MDVLARLERWARVKTGEMPDFTGNGPWGDALNADLLLAIAEIKRLRSLVGAVSDLPAEDEQRLNKVYGGEGGYRGR